MSDVIVPEGQEALESSDTGTGSNAPEQKPFLKIDDSTFFNTPDEAIKAFKEGTMRHSEIKKARAELDENRRRHENEKADWFRRQAEWDEKIGYHKKVDDFFKANPKAYQTIKQMISQGTSGEDVQEIVKRTIDETIGPKLSEYERQEKERRAKEERDRYFGEMKGKYPDFDDKSVSALYDELMAPTATMGTFIETLYHALKGRNLSPAQIEKKVIDNLEGKRQAGIPTSKGASYSGERKVKETNIRKLAEKLKSEVKDETGD
jgi:hypothetical protein